jgi:hypothetical protein
VDRTLSINSVIVSATDAGRSQRPGLAGDHLLFVGLSVTQVAESDVNGDTLLDTSLALNDGSGFEHSETQNVSASNPLVIWSEPRPPKSLSLTASQPNCSTGERRLYEVGGFDPLKI